MAAPFFEPGTFLERNPSVQPSPLPLAGFDAFVSYVSDQAAQAPSGWAGAAWFVLQVGQECAGIRLQDLGQPTRFLRQLAAASRLQFGVAGFAPALVDDENPARHYIAFVFVGFWLPPSLALAVLYAWEVAGFIRYRGQWSQRDVQAGSIGLRHGRWVATLGPAVLPGLIAGELGPFTLQR